MENLLVIPAIRTSGIKTLKAPIVIRIVVGRHTVKTLNTGIRIDPKHWDPVNRVILKGETNHHIYNLKLKKEVSRIESDFTQKSMLGIHIIIALVKPPANNARQPLRPELIRFDGLRLGRVPVTLLPACKAFSPALQKTAGTLQNFLLSYLATAAYR